MAAITIYSDFESESEVAQSRPTLCHPVDCNLQAPLSMGFSRQEYYSGLPCPPPGDLPDPEIEPASLMSLHWQVDSLPLAPPGKSRKIQSEALLGIWLRLNAVD